MDFELNEDQEALAEGVAALCAGRFDIETVRSMASAGLDRGRWAELAETGVFSLTRPEAVWAWAGPRRWWCSNNSGGR